MHTTLHGLFSRFSSPVLQNVTKGDNSHPPYLKIESSQPTPYKSLKEKTRCRSKRKAHSLTADHIPAQSPNSSFDHLHHPASTPTPKRSQIQLRICQLPPEPQHRPQLRIIKPNNRPSRKTQSPKMLHQPILKHPILRRIDKQKFRRLQQLPILLDRRPIRQILQPLFQPPIRKIPLIQNRVINRLPPPNIKRHNPPLARQVLLHRQRRQPCIRPNLHHHPRPQRQHHRPQHHIVLSRPKCKPLRHSRPPRDIAQIHLPFNRSANRLQRNIHQSPRCGRHLIIQ